jgi:hypothetical protein
MNIPIQLDKASHEVIEEDSGVRIGIKKVRVSSIVTEMYMLNSKKKEEDEPCFKVLLDSLVSCLKVLCCLTDTSEGEIRSPLTSQELPDRRTSLSFQSYGSSID